MKIFSIAGLTFALVLPVLAQSTWSTGAATLRPIAAQDRDWDHDRDRDRDHDRDRDDDRGHRGGYRGVLAPEWQQKFDSYYSRWQQYRATNNRDEMNSMEKRMRDIMTHYNIPPDVPYGSVASNGAGYGYGRRDRDRDGDGYGYGRRGYHNVLAPEWQSKFDSYYSRWLQYRQTNNRDEMNSMEGRMRDIMTHYNIPADTPYEAVASNGYRR